MCFLATLVLSVLKLFLSFSFDGVVFSKFIYLFVALSVFLVSYIFVSKIIKKDQSYFSSDVYLGYKHILVGLIILLVLFVLKLLYFGDNYLFYGISFFMIAISIFYSRMNYTFFLKNKLLEENEKFVTLYRTVVDDIIVGKKVIDKLLPDKKNVKGLEFEGYFKPVLLVGGDFFDVIPLSETRFVSYIADVSGHGVSAGIIVSMIKALISKSISEKYSDLSSVVRNLNSDFNNLVKETGKYATLFLILIDKTKKRFSYVSCGHTDCIYWSSISNQFFLLSSTAPVLGLFSKIDVYSSDVEFNENDYLIMLSDGIFSITSNGGNVFSYDDFIKMLSKYISSDIHPSELSFNISQEMEDIMEFGQVVDDITMLFIKL
ncbi:MAG: PP2C family protein-serine/threonine phosphatase [Brevinematia bacterium]